MRKPNFVTVLSRVALATSGMVFGLCLPSNAVQLWNWSYSGGYSIVAGRPSIGGSGTFTTDDGPNSYLITGITGTAEGETIVSLAPTHFGNDNILYATSPQFSQGILFAGQSTFFMGNGFLNSFNIYADLRYIYNDIAFGATLATGSIPGTTPSNPLLPTPNPNNPNGFTFPNVTVTPGQRRFFDPDVAVGYDYAVTGGSLFSSVLIPNALPQGDSNFTLELPGFGNYSLIAGTTFDLLGINPSGFSNFRIM